MQEQIVLSRPICIWKYPMIVQFSCALPLLLCTILKVEPLLPRNHHGAAHSRSNDPCGRGACALLAPCRYGTGTPRISFCARTAQVGSITYSHDLKCTVILSNPYSLSVLIGLPGNPVRKVVICTLLQLRMFATCGIFNNITAID